LLNCNDDRRFQAWRDVQEDNMNGKNEKFLLCYKTYIRDGQRIEIFAIKKFIT